MRAGLLLVPLLAASLWTDEELRGPWERGTWGGPIADDLGASAPSDAGVSDAGFADAGTPAPTITIDTPTTDPTADVGAATTTVSGTTSGTLSAVTWSNSAGGSGSCTTGSGTFSCASVTLSANASNVVTVTADGPDADGTDVITITRIPPGSPSLWFDGSNVDGSSNATLANNDPISTWTDRGSLAKNATAAGAARPTFLTPCASGKLNNRACASFDGGDRMTTAAFTAITQSNLVCVVGMHTTTGSMADIDGDDSGNRHLIWVNATKHEIAASTQLAGANASANAYFALCATFNGASSSIRVNASATSGSAGSQSLDGLSIGGSFAGSVLLNGRIAEILVYDTVPTVTDVEAYLTSKYAAFPQ